MSKLRSRSVAAAITGGILAFGAIAVGPALAYPVGTALTLACTPAAPAPGASITCTLSNIDPAGPNSITLGGLVSAGDGVSFERASLVAAVATTYSQTLTAPTTPGTYEVTGTSGSESASTTIQVTSSGSTGGSTSGSGAATTPDTGANVTLGLVAGLGALGLGGGIYAASRRKKV